jgi:hypothetical protein
LETIEELGQFIVAATADGVRGRLLARGQARAIIRRNGMLPPEAPPLGDTIETDLGEYGFSLLRAALALRERGGAPEYWRVGFETAASAFESLVRNGAPDDVSRGFHRVLAAAAYHLAGYSAIAYSIFAAVDEAQNFAPAERGLALLILRDLPQLRQVTSQWLRRPEHSDEQIGTALAQGQLEADDAIAQIITSSLFRGLAYFDLALQTGDAALVERADQILETTLKLATHAASVPLWWIVRLARSTLGDLWGQSLHVRLSPDGPGGQTYADLRRQFIGGLYARKSSEVELWPSQVQAAVRALDQADDLVTALPTSAGKTRIAELCALVALSNARRVLIVTPLRALSAQTERSFRRTFAPLGFSVSSLYGASGLAAGDADALRTRHIVIATPEKLDFALRSDPTIIDDVGLVVLDEGHLIGPSERELRYEILVQRLLRRADADARRIVCLSAILPDGQQLEDLTSWVRSDAPGAPVRSNWRPTRQRFGVLAWNGQSARLSFDLEDDGPFIPRFFEQAAAIRPRRTPFPRDNRELTLAAAWRFSAESKRVLIFCSQRDHVEGYAEAIVDICRRGFLPPLLDDPAAVGRALEVGREWLGENHPAVACLRLGVAVHHARLPNPFLREVERLLNEGVLKVTVASPTVAQGLNLNAAVLLVPSLYRSGVPLTGEEFANVAGRAGRAFVDVEGLIVHTMFDPAPWRIEAWRTLVQSARARSLESGLVQVIDQVLQRLARSGVLQRADAVEYLANQQDGWGQDVPADGEEPLSILIERLDAAVLGLIEALDADSADLPALLDEALNGSLWARQISRRTVAAVGNQKALLATRARFIWSRTTYAQRRGHFAMGVGLEAGLAIDAIADNLYALLDAADLAAIQGEPEDLANALTRLGEMLLQIRPFTPEGPLPAGWREVLRSWVAGVDVAAIGVDNMRLVEDVFAYRLVWALEALRTRRAATGFLPDFIDGTAAASLEAGVPKITMSLLIRAGLLSRTAAIVAVNELNPIFTDSREMAEWLGSNEVTALTDTGLWPTPATAEIWTAFRNDALSGGIEKWRSSSWRHELTTVEELSLFGDERVCRAEQDAQGYVWIKTPDFRPLLRLPYRCSNPQPSLLHAEFSLVTAQVHIHRIGRGELEWA